ncbi:MAG: double zinc ribbon domain-containing protein, partial [Candidatus Kryptoniota bacterium]
MFCTNCGQKNEERSAFCVNCGTALSGSHTPPSRKEGNLFGKKFCTRCGKDNRYYAEACKRCGGKEFTTKQTFDIWKKNWNSRSSF